MTSRNAPFPLVVLVADRNMYCSVSGILKRPHSLGIKDIHQYCTIKVHPHHDPGCLRQSDSFLSVFRADFSHALVIFDRVGCGKETKNRETLESEVEDRLSRAGWENCSAAVVIDPELENWVWAPSRHLPEAVGWEGDYSSMKEWVAEEGFAFGPHGKPTKPKEAFERILYRCKVPRSSDLYQTLASKVSLEHCTDASFIKFRNTIQEWFGNADSRFPATKRPARI